MAQQLFEQWFRIADADKDGAVGGGEAVSFFMRSALPQLVLGQIWELASGGAPKLNQTQFSAAMRLVALAQARGGQLPLDQARAVIAGVGPALPPPTLQGLDPSGAATGQPGAPFIPSAATATGAPRPVGVTVSTAAAPQYGAAMGAVPSPYNAQLTGGPGSSAAGLLRPIGASGGGSGGGAAVGVAPGAMPAAAAAPSAAAAAGGYPLLAASDIQRLQASFVQLDADRDGFVTGAECFGFFSQSGLEKPVLRDIWSLVAGNESRLSSAQFVAFLYLIDCVKRGLPLPKYLPPGLPVAWSLQSQFGTSSNITAVLAAPQTTSLPAPPPPPTLPAKLDLAAMAGERLTAPPSASQHVSHVPAVPPALLANVSAMDRTKLQEELQAYTAAQAASEKSAAVHSHIMELMGQKGELQEKMKRLESEVAAAERMGPADVARLEGELSELTHRCSALEAARNAKMAKVDGLRRQQEAVRAKLGELADADRDAAAEVEACESSLESLQQELKEARSSGSAAALPTLLSRAANVYRGLYGLAQRMGTTVPFEALPASLEGLHVWADEVAAGVIDWPDDDVDARGFVIVNALPGADAPRPIVKAVAGAAAAAVAAAAAPKPAMGAAPAAATQPSVPAAAATAAAKVLPNGFAAAASVNCGDGGGFDNALAFGDAPAFGLPASGSNVAPPPAPPGAAAPSAPIDFGFDDAPAFGAPAALPAAATAAPPPGLHAPSSFAIDPAAPLKAAETSPHQSYSGGGMEDLPNTQMNRFGSAFSFGDGGEGQRSVDTPTFVPAPSDSAVAAAMPSALSGAADADFGGNAFTAGMPAPTHAAAAAVVAAGAAAPPAEQHAPLATTPSLFGDDAFGTASARGFSEGAFAAAQSAAAVAAATAVAADSRSSSVGGAPTALPPMDSGPLQENPFAGGPPPSLAAAVASATAATTTVASVGLPPPPTTAATTDTAAGVGTAAVSAELFGDNAFGTAPAFSLPPQPPAQQHVTPATAPPPPPPPPAATRFEDDNPFGDSDNPFGTTAFR
ncbi:hypothetical protein VOLCADRAFT_103432 [Volvox carteri f. nagariensis]|uniref:EH domain-containing protein n=1 Tax=Volvox carteri f. nagariensis TaxID=3068 RepID=D8TLT6_VOLCA|nr:uncharacterized protein VOLCADRAFT_103432 [Volvox carteri f. nagariensis]EFJ51520.1 hypothetical protein VOLCADRAFT_103432 [Volvox carteri f. nagariensis]|eukprot:XP_002947472.1 hypothetical protein VOLCADRAFT_103432 [Volvox carteri f. nagariensis]